MFHSCSKGNLNAPLSGSCALLRGGGDFLDVDGFLGGIEFAGELDVLGGEVFDGFGIFDNPDGVIFVWRDFVGDKDGALGFPFGVADGSAAAPAFLDAIGAAGFGVLGGASFIADPAGARGVFLLRGDGAEREETAKQQKCKNCPAADHVSSLGSPWATPTLTFQDSPAQPGVAVPPRPKMPGFPAQTVGAPTRQGKAGRYESPPG
jgi:hypothetical protein